MNDLIKPKDDIRPSRTVSLSIEDADGPRTLELGVLDGTLGPSVIEVSKLYGETGYFTYDPGFMATASCH